MNLTFYIAVLYEFPERVSICFVLIDLSNEEILDFSSWITKNYEPVASYITCKWLNGSHHWHSHSKWFLNKMISDVSSNSDQNGLFRGLRENFSVSVVSSENNLYLGYVIREVGIAWSYSHSLFKRNKYLHIMKRSEWSTHANWKANLPCSIHWELFDISCIASNVS